SLAFVIRFAVVVINSVDIAKLTVPVRVIWRVTVPDASPTGSRSKWSLKTAYGSPDLHKESIYRVQ
ncbi:hypothetical protein, partial [Curtobacterium sp. MCBA15_008]|uniref:hypothetical protein n=1 Tax=Curtobacterium sp. MCBA15_008 TaxID=1898736 RepID=UPI001C31263E